MGSGAATRLNPAIGAALASAVLFGLSTPLAKLLLGDVDPLLIAGLFYLGCGVGLLAWRTTTRAPAARPAAREWPWLAGAVLCGGVLAPPILLVGLSGLSASGASLLLNAEGVLTAVLAWMVFGENVDRRVGLGMLAIVAGGVALAWPSGGVSGAALEASLLVVLACLLWAVDNNLTRRVSGLDATWVAMLKGLVAGSVNTTLGVVGGAAVPSAPAVAGALVVGFACYAVSLTLFVIALRGLGTARTGAYFSLAPFVGAALAIPLLGEAVTWQLATAGVLMAVGVWLHLTESHEHHHHHPAQHHDHWHDHADGHHDHDHPGEGPFGPHRHEHEHAVLAHTHPHYPDQHHRHSH